MIVKSPWQQQRLNSLVPAQFASPRGHHTLLTGPTGERWKAVRKSVATAFSTANMKALYPKIRDACAKVRCPDQC